MPGKLPEQLRSELSKNKRVFETLAKLDMNGNMPELWNCLYKIYDDENQSIIHNITKTKQEQDITPEFRNDHVKGLKIFKENIIQIVQMIVDYLHSSVMSETEDPQSYDTTMKSVTARNDSVETEVAIGEPPQHQKSYLSILSEHIGPEKSFQMRTLGNDFEPIPSKPKRINLDKPPILILPDKQGIERLYVRHTRHESQGGGSPSPANHLPQLLDNTYTSNRSRNQKRHYRLQSEFNYVKGSVKFNQSIRKPFLKDTSESPGPANYTFDASLSPILKRYGVVTMGKAPRKTTLGVIGSNDSPGPAGYYPSRHLVIKG